MRAPRGRRALVSLAMAAVVALSGCASFERLEADDPNVGEEEVFEAGQAGDAAMRLDHFHHVLDHRAEYDPEVVAAALTSVGEVADPSSVPHVVPLADDPDEEIRWHAATALGAIGGPEAAVVRARMAAHDPSELVREEAAR